MDKEGKTTDHSLSAGEDTVVNVTGNINTIKVADTQNFDEDIGGRSNQILTRLLVGGESCDPRNGAKQE